LERCAAVLPAPSCGGAAWPSRRIEDYRLRWARTRFPLPSSIRRSLRLGATHRVRQPQPRLRHPVIQRIENAPEETRLPSVS
jgi:hypothetical protein